MKVAADEAELSDAALQGRSEIRLLPQTDPLLTLSKFFKLCFFDELLLLDEVVRCAVETESLEDDRFEEVLRTDAPLRLLDELRMLATLLELRQLAELRDEHTEDAAVRDELSVRAESNDPTSLKLSFE